MIGLVSSRAAAALDTDLPLLLDAMPEAEVVAWDDAEVEWARYRLAIVRLPWDYVSRRDEFLAWARHVATVAALWNPPDLLEWSTDKRYLLDLAARGIPIVPTTIVRVDDEVPTLDGDVVKPTVGAGSGGAARFRHHSAAAEAHVRQLHAQGLVAMVQPSATAVDDVGESGLVYLGGTFSHAFRKGAILNAEIEWEGGLFAKEEISPAEPTPGEPLSPMPRFDPSRRPPMPASISCRARRFRASSSSNWPNRRCSSTSRRPRRSGRQRCSVTWRRDPQAHRARDRHSSRA